MRKSWLMVVALAAPVAAQNAPSLFENARTAALTPGQWRYSATPAASEARFGASFAIRCDCGARLVTLRRTDGAAGAMTIGTDLAVRVLPVDGVVATSDPVLDAIAFSRGRFIVSGGSVLRLILPASPEAARSIEDCRN